MAFMLRLITDILKFRTRLKAISPPPEVSQLAKLYAEFAEEDRQLADGLVKDDTK